MLGQVDPRLLPPPRAPMDWSMVLGWVAISATALGLFWGASEGWGTGPRRVQSNGRRRRISRNAARRTSKPSRAKFNDLSVLMSAAAVREAAPRRHHDMLPPGVASKLKRLPPGIYKYGWGPKRGEVIQPFRSASLLGAITSTRIGAAKSGEFHWVIDNLDPKFPVVIRGIDGAGKTVFRVEEYAKQFELAPAVKKRRASSRSARK